MALTSHVGDGGRYGRISLCILVFLFCLLSSTASPQSHFSRGVDFSTGSPPPFMAARSIKGDAKRVPTTSPTLPLRFEVNRGQATRDVDFVAYGPGYSAQLRKGSLVVGPGRTNNSAHAAEAGQAAGVQIVLSGANRKPRAVGEGKLPGLSNYLDGSDPAKWITGVESYAKVRYRDVYPGIDVLFDSSRSRLEQDFLIRPGANPKRIRLDFKGVQSAELTSDGVLVLRQGDVSVSMQSLRAYQLVQNQEVKVPVRYELQNGQASFRLGGYDRRRALIIDPLLVFATFFGGAATSTGVYQAVASMAVDASGIYVTGPTNSTSFPVTSGVVGPSSQSIFVSKLDPTGQSLIFSTYLAGFSGEGTGFALTVDNSENIYIAGAAAAGLPIPPGSEPFQGTMLAMENVAILKLNSTGTAVLAATYLGGSGATTFDGIAIDSSDNVYVTGQTSSNDFPVQNALQGSLGTSGSSAFVTKLNPTLSGLVYSTYLGGNSDVSSVSSYFDSVAQSIALDSSGDAYVIGLANAGFPTTSDAYQPTCPDNCAFFAKLNANDSALLYATYLGDSSGAGGATEAATAVAVDSAEDAYIAGETYSASFPVVSPIQSCSAIEGIESSTNPSGNFLSEFNSAVALTFSTCLGINQWDEGLTIYQSGPVLTLDAAGDAYFGASSQSGLPLQNPIDANEPAEARPFVSEISADTHALLFSSFVAGPVTYSGTDLSSGDLINAIAVDSSGDIYLGGSSTAGTSQSQGYSYFPVFNPMQSYFFNPDSCPLESPKPVCTYTDGFIMKVAPSAGAAAASVPAELQFPTTDVGSTSAPLGTTIYDLGTDALTVSNVAASGDFAVQSNSCGTVPASGGSCTIQVTFTPTAPGTRNGTLSITDSSAGSPHTVTLTGLGSTANLTVSPTQLTFASQAVGTTSTQQTVTVTANTAAIQVTRVQASGAFAETNSCGTSIPAFGSCQVLVTFTPTAAGALSGSITITDSAPNSPQTVSLTGTGQAPSLGLSVAPGSSGSATVTAGGSAQYSLLIGGAGMSGAATLSCGGAPSGASCIVPATETLSATTAVNFNVGVNTTAPSAGALVPAGSPTLSWQWAVGLVGCAVVPAKRRRKRWVRRCLCLLPWLLLVLSSCGGRSGTVGSGGTPSGTYPLTVTAALNGVQASIQLTLKVQ